MKFIKRKNKQSGVMEAIAQANVILDSIESTSRTNSNGKSFGFLGATLPTGERVSGIAYDKTAKSYANVATDSVLIETLVTNLVAGEHNKWQLSLAVASDVSTADIDKAKAFLASL